MHPTPSRRRAGFTMVELLIVIAIIAILLSLSASATVRVIDVQRGNNSEQTVKIVSEALDRAWQAVVDKAKNEQIPPQIVSTLAGGDMRIARVIWIKLRLKQEFPMTFAEACSFVVAGVPQLAPIPAYADAVAVRVGNNWVPAVRAGSQTSESSVCLLLALQQARGGITFDADRLGSGAVADAGAVPVDPANPQHVTKARSLKQIVDGFSNGIAFFRWPTGNPELNPGGNPQPGHKDPGDPEGLLTAKPWVNNSSPNYRQQFQAVLHPIPDNPGATPNPRSYYLIPVVSSAGRNGQFGLNMTTMAPVGTPELYNDNVDSYRLRFGARGD